MTITISHRRTAPHLARPLLAGLAAALLLSGCSNREDKLAEAIAAANAAAERAEQAAKRAEAAAKNADSQPQTETVINEVEPDPATPEEDTTPAE